MKMKRLLVHLSMLASVHMTLMASSGVVFEEAFNDPINPSRLFIAGFFAAISFAAVVGLYSALYNKN